MEASDEALQGLDLALTRPLKVTGRLQATGEGELFWRGELSGEVRGTCRRCLTEVILPVSARIDALFSTDPEAADDPSVYPLAP
ncbi:MAG TPA: hypothetical protein VG712_07020, partial [Gemmatimonadales bacterium]|nr:hypothetical protein [Gemmatimonadales bacterium]